jgi:hypothetical protein
MGHTADMLGCVRQLPHDRLLIEVWVVVMMMVVVVYYHHNLRLCRIGCCEAEDESECEQNLFHALV